METSGRAPFLTRLIIAHFALMVNFYETINAKTKHHCPPSFCGHLHNISYPFRLTTDPKHCGDSRYELSCENNISILSLIYPDSYKFYVHAINYNNYTIRIADPCFQKKNCSGSISVNFLYMGGFRLNHNTFETGRMFIRIGKGGSNMRFDQFETAIRYQPNRESIKVYQLVETIVFLTCEKPVRKPHHYGYIERYPCSKSLYSYVVGENFTFSDLEESCRIDQMSLISTRRGSGNLESKTTSYEDIHNELVYGFELSWLPSFGKHNLFGESNCYVKEDSNKVHCNSSSAYQCRRYNKYCSTGFLEKISSSVAFYYRKLRMYLYNELLWGPRLICTILLISFLIYKWNTRHWSMYDNIENFLQSHVNLMPVRYSYWEIKEMSNGFKVKLGEGGFGCVYKGKLSSGRSVAIKMLGKSKVNGQDFVNEIAPMGRIHHVNVVRLIGFCFEGSKRAFIFDFMPNGSLDKFIFSKEGISNFLSYEEIHKISLGVARGIEYLHQGCYMRILHFDIKPHNILLDENFIPKVSDFGLARLCPLVDSKVSLTAARGTIGYIAPELFYKNIGGVSYKADVYSFGKLLMEMANKRSNANDNAKVENSSEETYFPLWIYDRISKGKDMEIEDATEEELKTVKKMIIVALWCIQLKPCDRPSMNKVIEMLEGELDSLQMPPKPYLYPQVQAQVKHSVEDAGETSCSISTLSEEDSEEPGSVSDVACQDNDPFVSLQEISH